MIFVTVGTHEQGLDRLLIELDRLIDENKIDHKVFAQIGYSSYIPKNYEFKKLMTYNEMDEMMRKSNIIITHGGPGSIFHAIQYKKIPIVVPRNPDFKEHVDNHQILFAKRLEANSKIIGIYDISNLGEKINRYEIEKESYKIEITNKKEFIKKFSKLIESRLE